jgi:hypothetical protein
VQEWSYFGGTTRVRGRSVRRGHQETDKGYYQRVGDYWRFGTGLRRTGLDTDDPWSATFISYVMRKAGVTDRDFRRAAAHARYIHFAIQNRLGHKHGAVFHGWRLTEYRPKEGDLVCYSRAGSGITFDKAIKRDAYKSHSDIVVCVRPGEIGVIGGNVGDSVTLKFLTTTAGGYLNDRTESWFAVLENRLPFR